MVSPIYPSNVVLQRKEYEWILREEVHTVLQELHSILTVSSHIYNYNIVEVIKIH